MTTTRIVFAALVLVLYPSRGHATTPARCPERCHCKRQLQIVSCRGLQLQKLPENIPSCVQKLYLDNNLITQIPPKAFSELHNLSVLSLTKNVITDVFPGAFNGLQRLNRLDLKNNQLYSLDKAVFNGLDSLTSLYLSQNKLRAIPDVGLARNLSKLDLEHNQFSSAHFPDGYSQLQKLKSVVLSNNVNIKSLNHTDLLSLKSSGVTRFRIARCSLRHIANDTFTNFTALGSLKLSHNPHLELTAVKALVVSLSGSVLTDLDLSGILETLPADLFRPLSDVPMRDLVLSHSKFGAINNGTFKYLGKLFHLDLSYGQLKTTDVDAFTGLLSVERIKLDHNSQLGIFPHPLPGNLTILDLSYTAMTDIPDGTFVGLDKLTDLSLSHCSLRVFRKSSFSGLSGLLSLDLSHNAIGGNNIGAKFFKPMPRLETLALNSNQLTTIATEFSLFTNLPNLRKLYLNDNNCRNLSLRLFDKLHKLEVLHLQDNSLGYLIKSDTGGVLFSKLTALRELHLENNGLTSLPGEMIRSLGSLQTLYLQENSISNWGDGFFNGTTSVRMVNLTSNKISYINESSLSGLSNNVCATELCLSANPFSCGCDLIWFRDWLDTINSSRISIPDIDKCKCSTPVSLAGRPLSEFHPEDIRTTCFPPPWLYIIVGAVGGGVSLVLLLVSVIYANRWSLRISKYRFKQWLRQKDTSRPSLQGYESLNPLRYDVFISYGPSEDSRDWVTSALYPELMSFVDEERIFFEEKATPNGNLLSELAESIDNSRTAILVVTTDYLEDSRRVDYEVRLIMAHAASMGALTKGMILILHGSNIGERLPTYLRPLLGASEFLWPEGGPKDTEREAFWGGLRDQLNELLPASSKGNNSHHVFSNVPDSGDLEVSSD